MVVYVITIFGGQRIMKNYKPFNLRMPLAYWNLLLSVFSFIGVSRVVPHFFYLYVRQGMFSGFVDDFRTQKKKTRYTVLIQIRHCSARSGGFHTVACGPPEPLYGNGAVGFWVQAFVLSKLFELIDTLFIVLRKRELMFLHW